MYCECVTLDLRDLGNHVPDTDMNILEDIRINVMYMVNLDIPCTASLDFDGR